MEGSPTFGGKKGEKESEEEKWKKLCDGAKKDGEYFMVDIVVPVKKGRTVGWLLRACPNNRR